MLARQHYARAFTTPRRAAIQAFCVTSYGAPLEPRSFDLPTPKGDEVLIRTTFAALCHSDLHQIDGYFDMSPKKMKMQKQFPFTVGHEIEGEVVAVGPNAYRLHALSQYRHDHTDGGGPAVDAGRGGSHSRAGVCPHPQHVRPHPAGGPWAARQFTHAHIYRPYRGFNPSAKYA